jgi:hypothetical protein
MNQEDDQAPQPTQVLTHSNCLSGHNNCLIGVGIVELNTKLFLWIT